MRHFRLLDPSRAPREGHCYIDPDTAYVSFGKVLDVLIANAATHRRSNGLPVPDDFPAVVQTQICVRHPGDCVSLDGSPPDLTCAHRGELVRYEGCESCGGVRAKIMACAVHGEATLFKHDMGVHACALCRERVSTIDIA